MNVETAGRFGMSVREDECVHEGYCENVQLVTPYVAQRERKLRSPMA